MKIFTLSALAIILFCSGLLAQVKLPQLVSNGMVLQRDVKLAIWGWAAKGEKISARFQGKNYRAVADAKGNWSFNIPPMQAGGPYTMQIDAANHITLTNIMVGDVWFCSGQSNMATTMERVSIKYPEEINQVNNTNIRYFFVPTVSDVTKLHDDLPAGKWVPATPEYIMNFGAVSYFFAKDIYNRHHIPIGVINSSVGGTPIQAWISEEGLKQIPQYANRVAQLKNPSYLYTLTHPEKKADPISINPQVDLGTAGPRPWFDTAYVAKGWHPFWLPGYWDDQGVSNLHGVIWFRKEINVPAAMAGKPAKFFMGTIVDADFAYVNGVLCGNTTYQFPPRRYKIPAGVLKAGKNIIVIKVINRSPKGGFVPQKEYFIEAEHQRIDLRGDWQYQVGQVYDNSPTVNAPTFSAQSEPTGLYNTMVYGAINYKIKGFLWYQGEANSDKPAEYNQLLPALISDWRGKWGQGTLPFIYAQLPNFMDVQYSPSESKWAELREAQLKTLLVSNTGMAVNIDIGEWNDIHPLDKKDVAERMALNAEQLAYGNKTIVAMGPVYRDAKVEGDHMVISFKNNDSELVSHDGGELKRFAIAGADKRFVWAKAVISGNTVIVSNENIKSPLYVRYAWANNPEGANLYNKAGLPASPFRTDGP